MKKKMLMQMIIKMQILIKHNYNIRRKKKRYKYNKINLIILLRIIKLLKI